LWRPGKPLRAILELGVAFGPSLNRMRHGAASEAAPFFVPRPANRLHKRAQAPHEPALDDGCDIAALQGFQPLIPVP
jgi:hypothetical protein